MLEASEEDDADMKNGKTSYKMVIIASAILKKVETDEAKFQTTGH